MEMKRLPPATVSVKVRHAVLHAGHHLVEIALLLNLSACVVTWLLVFVLFGQNQPNRVENRRARKEKCNLLISKMILS